MIYVWITDANFKYKHIREWDIWMRLLLTAQDIGPAFVLRILYGSLPRIEYVIDHVHSYQLVESFKRGCY